MQHENPQDTPELRHKRLTYLLSGAVSMAIFGLIGAGLYDEHPVEALVSYGYTAMFGAVAIAGYRENLPKKNS